MKYGVKNPWKTRGENVYLNNVFLNILGVLFHVFSHVFHTIFTQFAIVSEAASGSKMYH